MFARGEISSSRKPSEGTKQEQVLTMLRQPKGGTVALRAEPTRWAQHTVRGSLAALKKKGHAAEVLERAKQIGPNTQGVKESYRVYRVVATVREAGRGARAVSVSPSAFTAFRLPSRDGPAWAWRRSGRASGSSWTVVWVLT